jgi:predicted Zn-dependent protease
MARALRDRAQAAATAGKHKLALDLYLELERIAPGEPSWPKRAGDVHRRLGQAGAAARAFDRAATSYMRNGFVAQAIAMYHLILQLAPGDPDVRARLAALEAHDRR